MTEAFPNPMEADLTRMLAPEETAGLPEHPRASATEFREAGHRLATTWGSANMRGSAKNDLPRNLLALQQRLKDRLAACAAISHTSASALELLESSRMLKSVATDALSRKREFAKLPLVVDPRAGRVPRMMRVADEYVATADAVWDVDTLRAFVDAVQKHDRLRLHEVLLLPVFLKAAVLEHLLTAADEVFRDGASHSANDAPALSAPLHALRRIDQFDWSATLEKLVLFRAVLARDPFAVFDRMDADTRNRYMGRVADLAAVSDHDELATAEIALQMATEAANAVGTDPRLHRRMAHVGYYLFEEGFEEYSHRIGYHPTPTGRIAALLMRYNESFYIYSIFLISVFAIAAFIWPLVPRHPLVPVLLTLLLALLPATQGASDLVNNFLTSFLRPRVLPKMDYSAGIPDEAATLVAVPVLLMDEHQVRELFHDLESRWLANRDRNLHFGLVTDLPDSEKRPAPEDRNELVDLAVALTDELNARYQHQGGGSFLLLHRHRIYNVRQGVWMGWERKRGKLLDLNKLMCGAYDSFPVKAGPTEVLSGVRYVITLDSDTQLPRDSAARMVGTMEHPLNRAIVDPQRRIVTRGYGILQPRVSVSVASASRSRLASIYSGETGFDIYTTAVSDVYQDLFGEAIFTGKGIYEAGILHEVLDARFPRNTLLSHDLIEGAYARVGLATDIEVVDDYPSHYAAHSRRRHRWVRGDWQILQWLSLRVPDETGRMVQNPISLISQWKIFDNLRRSLIEPVTFVLFVFGWFFLPGGPVYWTCVTLLLILLPVFVQIGYVFANALIRRTSAGLMDGFWAVARALGFQLLNLCFLTQQALLLGDAIIRSLIRSFLTGHRLLEWETAAQAERGHKSSPLNHYLWLSPIIALLLAGIMWVHHDTMSLRVGSPILLLWLLAPAITRWLDLPPRAETRALSAEDLAFLRRKALQTWRFYHEFGGEENHWLIPDNVEEDGMRQAPTLSPTNLGMLLNARQAALRLGFLTLPEFTRATLGTLATYDKLDKVQGHIYNWVDIPTLKPIQPFTISTVDSGNLAASLCALHGGATGLLKVPLLCPETLDVIAELAGSTERPGELLSTDPAAAVLWLLEMQLPLASASWIAAQTHERHAHAVDFIDACMPWLMPRFAQLRSILLGKDAASAMVPTLAEAPQQAAVFLQRLDAHTLRDDETELAAELRIRLAAAVDHLTQLRGEVQRIADLADWHAHAMKFDFLLSPERGLLSIGYDVAVGKLYPSCYDLLASEARLATFFAIAKGDIPQRAWLRLGRTHARVRGRIALLSWTGTMFEYLMPTLWVRHFPETLMSRAIDSAIKIQQDYVRDKPWGISESGMAKRDAQGHYGYKAWGVPQLALKYEMQDGPVISPYSTFLALPFARESAMRNLRRMAEMGWTGAYGFYEAADYSGNPTEPVLVRSWMAHHQGMSLLAVTNVLCDNAFERWFHCNPRIRAAETLLHEKPLAASAMRQLAEVALPSEPRASAINT